MILVGSQRGGARDLAQHLFKDENDHVEVHEVSGFAARTVEGAFKEAYALSRATRAKQFLFSLSVNPPKEARVSTAEFERTIDRAEAALGLTGQPRVIVFHEKEGRRHAHAVWSRIDTNAMRAVHLPLTKKKLTALTRQLFVEYGWLMPKGLADPSLRDPRNFTLAQWQQAKRAGKDPRAIKTALMDAWAISDSRAAFVQALEERGYRLARGDQRGFVVIDHKLEIYALGKKWLEQGAGAVRERLGDPDSLPGVEETKEIIARDMRGTLGRLQGDLAKRQARSRAMLDFRLKTLIDRQRSQRRALREHQERRQVIEALARQARFRRGLSGLWDRLRGEHGRVRRRNEKEAAACERRDVREREALGFKHIAERRRIDLVRMKLAERFGRTVHALEQDRQGYALKPPPMRERAKPERSLLQSRRRSRGPEPDG